MPTKTWLRPESVPYPSVWKKFTRTNKNGQFLHFEIQDITEDLFPACIEYMTKYFLHDEPMYTSLGFSNDQVSVQEQHELWKQYLPEKLSLICLVKDSENSTSHPKIAGMNLLYYHHKSHDEVASELKGETLKTVCDIVKHVEDQIDRYKLLNMEEYIDEFGLCVHPDYRGMGIATELLKARAAFPHYIISNLSALTVKVWDVISRARDKLGKAVGLNITFTMFTAIASQKAADKAGFKNLVEMKYSELKKSFPSHSFDVKDTPTIRYMCKMLSDT